MTLQNINRIESLFVIAVFFSDKQYRVNPDVHYKL